ncbi:MAG: hypothetical protein OXH50_14615, partial [Gemmatimonadetes bacterium]|nr:hypothetical protein [Gemmatimonadota bacterium]
MILLLLRLPVSLVVWFLLRPVYGPGWAMGGIAVTAAATAAGLAFPTPPPSCRAGVGGFSRPRRPARCCTSCSGGSHPANSGESSRTASLGAGLGGFAGIALLAAIGEYQDSVAAVSRGLEVFVILALQSAPALVLAYVAAALVYSLLPPASVNWMRRGSPLSQSARTNG